MIMIEIMINERSAKIQFEYTLYGPGGTRLGATLNWHWNWDWEWDWDRHCCWCSGCCCLLVLGLSWMRPVCSGRQLCAMREINGRAKEASGEGDG